VPPLVTLILICLLFCSLPAAVAAQEASAGEGAGQGAAIDTGEYEPYSPEEFPRWARKLRRFESIFFGSIPITFFFTSAGFETYAYIDHNYSPDYLPLFLGNSPAKQQYLADTLWQRVAVGLSLSALVAGLDYLLGLDGDAGRDRTDRR
jgi:hypothetical protein